MMETLGMMGAGLLNALAPINLFAIIASTTLGIVIGCLPGLIGCHRRGFALAGDVRDGPEHGFDRFGRYLLRCHFRRFN